LETIDKLKLTQIKEKTNNYGSRKD